MLSTSEEFIGECPNNATFAPMKVNWKLKPLMLVVLAFFCALSVVAQSTFPVNGVHNENHNFYAFTNATIYTNYETKLEGATLLIQDGRVVSVGNNIAIPEGTVVTDLAGRYIYPSLIEINSEVGSAIVSKSVKKTPTKKVYPANWNPSIHPEVNALDLLKPDPKKTAEWRKLGFGTVVSHRKDGIARGTSVAWLPGNGRLNELIIKDKAATHFSFKKGTSNEPYPSSLMGSIALLRQTFFDVRWYDVNKSKVEFNASLDALRKQEKLAHIIEVRDYQSALRASKIGYELDVQFVIKGAGDEYKRLEAMRGINTQFIVPLNFPKAYDVENPHDALLVSLADMKHWELAPTNPAVLEQANIDFALTTSDLKSKQTFFTNLRKALKHGLSEEMALKALTWNPARILGIDDQVGQIGPGTLANFLITSGPLFDKKTTLFENWVKGKKYTVNALDQVDIRGSYGLNIAGTSYDLEVKGTPQKPMGKLSVEGDTTQITAKLTQEATLITLSFSADDAVYKGLVRLSGKINYKSGLWDGNGQLADGKWVAWAAIKREPFVPKEKKAPKADSLSMGQVIYPFIAYGRDTLPEAETVLIRQATVWTNADTGILERWDVLIRNGKIEQVEKNIALEPDMVLINGRDKHLTPGIIDEHSHIAISKGVNEGGQAVSAEVRIGDVINSDDVNIYRQLSGGVTASQLLHGSANPIGGQSALIKLRWGALPGEMKIQGADGFIKFALGENVKRSRSRNDKRFPHTRMGVEQVFFDAFIRAKEYEAGTGQPEGVTKRRDLEMDAVLEILNDERFITCHSYVQSEINMLMNVADSMGFRVNTFTHILEGYKVADKMYDHGVGGSTFADWWAYKFEVNDAIPYNAALLHEQGVVVAINSDDAEMGRRLNQEAAKTMKYGGVSEEDALKMVTLNPAKLLHLDDRMGSIEVGKDADLVLWSDHPLSIYAKAEKTFVDGICYYDSEEDKEMRVKILAERTRLVAKLLRAKKAGADTQKPKPKAEELYHCDTILEEAQ